MAIEFWLSLGVVAFALFSKYVVNRFDYKRRVFKAAALAITLHLEYKIPKDIAVSLAGEREGIDINDIAGACDDTYAISLQTAQRFLVAMEEHKERPKYTVSVKQSPHSAKVLALR